MRLGIDVDGVLADFNTAFIDRVIAVTGRDLFPPRPFDIPTWNYPEHYGYTADETTTIWESIKADDAFWALLPEYADTRDLLERLWSMRWDHDIYFITARPGVQAKQQTEHWLHHGGYDNPTVLITSHKGLAAQTLGLHAYVDDRWENALDAAGVHWKGEAPKTRSFLLTRPWNAANDCAGTAVTRVHSVAAFLDAVTG